MAIKIMLTARYGLLKGRCTAMMQKNDVQTSRMVELLTTAAKLPDPMQALALGYAKGLADAAQLHQTSSAQPGKSA